jgi:DNA-binding NarL/FixJ family response regulator
VAQIDAWIRQRRHRTAADSRAVDLELTAHQIEVLDLMADGAGNREVASVVGGAEETVTEHLERGFEKFGVEDSTEAVTNLMRRGTIHID